VISALFAITWNWVGFKSDRAMSDHHVVQDFVDASLGCGSTCVHASSGIGRRSSPGYEQPRPTISRVLRNTRAWARRCVLIELAFFVAEHDDHHMAKLRQLKGHRGTHSPEL
jgi:hypothetical protein